MTQTQKSLMDTVFHFEGQKSHYKGKVRDVYEIDDLLVMVVSDRISAFDHVLPKPIPYKGQVLNQIAAHFLKSTSDLVPNWLLANPDPNVSIGFSCEPIRVEMVIRGYLAGHAWRTYNSGVRLLCGIQMPEGLKQNDPFPEAIITPTLKASEGHDEDISAENIIKSGTINEEDWEILTKYTRALYNRGQEMAKERGLILVDTKYEFGRVDGKIVLIDEIHTPDSSRYFYLDGYEERQKDGLPQKQLSKEFVREWLMENGFQGLEGQMMPTMPNDFINEISSRYIQLYELITGLEFIKNETDDIKTRIIKNVNQYFNQRNLC